MSKKLFGTDGIRGVANTWPMTAETALSVGRATAHICRQHGGRHRIVIGKDTRLSGYMIENALTAGICSMGVDVMLVGPMPTPGIAFITHSMRADAGIVISASHNPFQDNGIKIFSRDGLKISDELEREIESLVSTERIQDIRPTADEVGKAYRIDDAIGRYIVFCKNTFPDEVSLDGCKIVLDCANGATYKVAPIIFAELGAEIISIHNEPDGKNINAGCGSQFTEDLEDAVRQSGADIGLAFDGDGDRLIAIDENGNTLTGDHLLGISARHLKAAGQLEGDLVIFTPMSNFGLRKAFDDLGIEYRESAVGDRNVLTLMRETGAILGGEQSGHIIYRNHHGTGDGIISALQLLAIMRRENQKLSELATMITLAPQTLLAVPVATKPSMEDIPGMRQALEATTRTLGDNGRVLVRYSGTEPLCRVMVESSTTELSQRLAQGLAAIVAAEIG